MNTLEWMALLPSERIERLKVKHRRMRAQARMEHRPVMTFSELLRVLRVLPDGWTEEEAYALGRMGMILERGTQ